MYFVQHPFLGEGVIVIRSRSPNSTDKCRNYKAERRDPGSNPGPHNCLLQIILLANTNLGW